MQGLGAQDIGSSTVCGRCRRGAEPFDLYLERFPRSTPNQIKQELQQRATGGAVMGAGSGAMLLFNGNSSSFVPRAIQLGIPVAPQPVMQKGELWHSTSFVLNAVANHTATLSADLASSRGTAVDDLLRLDCVDIDPMGQSFGQTRSKTVDDNTDGHRRPLPRYP